MILQLLQLTDQLFIINVSQKNTLITDTGSQNLDTGYE